MKKVKVRKENLSKKSCSSFCSEKRTIIQKIIAAGVLTLAFLFSLNSYGVVNTITCGEVDTLSTYNAILKAQKNNLTPDVNFSLGYIAICIGNYDDGLKHMRSASEKGHVAATYVLGGYYDANQSFDNNQKPSTENIYRAITYYEKAVKQIEATSSYPSGVSKDMPSIEYVSMTSYRVFTSLPALYFNIHFKMMQNIVQNEASYPNTLEIIQKLGDAANHCLERPALSAWKEKKDLVYKTQQTECQAYLDFVTAIYPLENERLEIAGNCTVNIKQCKQHKGKINQMGRVTKTLFRKLRKSPGLNIAQSS